MLLQPITVPLPPGSTEELQGDLRKEEASPGGVGGTAKGLTVSPDVSRCTCPRAFARATDVYVAPLFLSVSAQTSLCGEATLTSASTATPCPSFPLTLLCFSPFDVPNQTLQMVSPTTPFVPAGLPVPRTGVGNVWSTGRLRSEKPLGLALPRRWGELLNVGPNRVGDL